MSDAFDDWEQADDVEVRNNQGTFFFFFFLPSYQRLVEKGGGEGVLPSKKSTYVVFVTS